MVVGCQRHPSAALPPENTRYPLYRRLGGSQGRSGQVWKISPPPPGFDHRTAHTVASRHTHYAGSNIALQIPIGTRKNLFEISTQFEQTPTSNGGVD